MNLADHFTATAKIVACGVRKVSLIERDKSDTRIKPDEPVPLVYSATRRSESQTVLTARR